MLNIVKRIHDINSFDDIENLPVIDLSKIKSLPDDDKKEIERLLNAVVDTHEKYKKISDDLDNNNSLNNINDAYDEKIKAFISDIDRKTNEEIEKINKDFKHNIEELKTMFSDFTKYYEENRVEQINSVKNLSENVKSDKLCQFEQEKQREILNANLDIDKDNERLKIYREKLMTYNKILVNAFNSINKRVEAVIDEDYESSKSEA